MRVLALTQSALKQENAHTIHTAVDPRRYKFEYNKKKIVTMFSFSLVVNARRLLCQRLLTT